MRVTSKIRFWLVAILLVCVSAAWGQSDSCNYTDIKLVGVKRSPTNNLPIGKTTVSTKMGFVFSTYEDRYIRIVFNGSTPQVHFRLTNKTSASIKLLWNDVVYAADGEQYSFIHQGQGDRDFDKEKIYATILDGSTLTDQIWPKISYEWGYMWANDGTEVRTVIPLQINGKTIKYDFRFNVVKFRGERYKDREDKLRWFVYKMK